jgi:hypothetical protein
MSCLFFGTRLKNRGKKAAQFIANSTIYKTDYYLKNQPPLFQLIAWRGDFLPFDPLITRNN